MKTNTAALHLLLLLAAQTVFPQTEKLGFVQYTPVSGWRKTPKPNIVQFSEINPTTGKFLQYYAL